jgi:hypothetical protein
MLVAIRILLAVAMATAPVLARASEDVPLQEVAGVEAGKPAPFTGLLLTEARFNAYVEQQKRAEGAEAKLATVEKQRDDLVKSDEACKARCPEDGTADGKRKFWLGATVGAVVVTAVLSVVAYGVVEAAKALNK